jgi:uncharacterized membrane protein YagU involved in acid resistance
MHPIKLFKSIMIGSVAGTLATVPMTAAMEALRFALLGSRSETFPPKQVTRAIIKQAELQKALRPFGEPGLIALTVVTHFGFGTFAGGLYGALQPLIKHQAPSETSPAPRALLHKGDTAAAATGAAFGLLVWSGSYFGWLPALGVVKPQGDHPIDKNIILSLSHIVWGASLGVMCNRMQEKSSKD